LIPMKYFAGELDELTRESGAFLESRHAIHSPTTSLQSRYITHYVLHSLVSRGKRLETAYSLRRRSTHNPDIHFAARTRNLFELG
jgi:hypothetical protein